MELTNKEQFLLDIQAYLMNNHGLSQIKALETMHDKNKMLEIDIIEDELAYFGIDIDELF